MVEYKDLETKITELKEVKCPVLVLEYVPFADQKDLLYDIVDVVKKNNIIHFSEKNDFVHYRINAQSGIRGVYQDIVRSTVYTNEYEGVIAIDITALPSPADSRRREFAGEPDDDFSGFALSGFRGATCNDVIDMISVVGTKAFTVIFSENAISEDVEEAFECVRRIA